MNWLKPQTETILEMKFMNAHYLMKNANCISKGQRSVTKLTGKYKKLGAKLALVSLAEEAET
jgi:aryl carrier-like protein